MPKSCREKSCCDRRSKRFKSQSLDWLNPIELNEEETRMFLESMEKPLDRKTLKKQIELHKIACAIEAPVKN